ncbi:MAG: hypothetical protein IT327_23030 [Anaerolineae bacterium]|nr:hypothetical protein [Anaerolineae bacterium]
MRRGGTARYGPGKNKRRWPRAVSPDDGARRGARQAGDEVLVMGEGFGPLSRARQAGDKVLVMGEGFGPPVPPLR